jgi:WD40 repeat protein
LSQRDERQLELELWDLASGELLVALVQGVVDSPELKFSPDGTQLILQDTSKSPRPPQSYCFRADGKSWKRESANTYTEVRKREFSPDGRLLAILDANEVISLFNLQSQRTEALEQRPGGRVLCFAFSRDGTLLAAGRQDHCLTVWNVVTRKVVAHFSDYDGPIHFVAFCLAGKALVGRDGTSVLWTRPLSQDRPRKVLHGVGGGITSVSLCADGRKLAASMTHQPVSIWDLATNTKEQSYWSKARTVAEVAFAPSGQTLLMRCDDSGIRVWRFLDTPDCYRMLVGHPKEAWCLNFSYDGTLLASGSDDNTIKLWYVETGQELLTLTGHEKTVTSLAFLPSGDQIVSVSLDGTLRIWRMTWHDANGLPMVEYHSTVLASYGEKLRALAVADDGQRLAVAGDRGIIYIWDLDRPHEKAQLKGHHRPVCALAYSPNFSLLASASLDRTVQLWDSKTGEHNDTKILNDDMRSAAFSSDGSLLAAGGDPRVVTLWSMNAQDVYARLNGHPSTVRSIAFTSDGNTIATACDDHKIRLWDSATGQYFFALLGHQARINAVVFSPDKRTLASCDHRGAIHLWQVGQPLSASTSPAGE